MICWDCSTPQGQEVCLTMIWWECSTGTGSAPFSDVLGLFNRDRECVIQWYAGIVLQGQEVCNTMMCWDCSTGTGSEAVAGKQVVHSVVVEWQRISCGRLWHSPSQSAKWVSIPVLSVWLTVHHTPTPLPPTPIYSIILSTTAVFTCIKKMILCNGCWEAICLPDIKKKFYAINMVSVKLCVMIMPDELHTMFSELHFWQDHSSFKR